MAKATGRLTFTPEPSQPFGVVPDLGRENLDGDAIAEQDVARAINRSHAAFAEQRLHLVLPVEHCIDDRRGVGLQDLAINRTEAHAIVVFCFAGSAVFHSGTGHKRRSRSLTHE